MEQLQLESEIDRDELVLAVEKLWKIPSDYTIKYAEPVRLDLRPIFWLRFVRVDERNSELTGEHLSVLYDSLHHRIMGVTFLDESLQEVASPSEEFSSAVAREFVERYAPDICQTLEVKWVQCLEAESKNPPHDTPLHYMNTKTGEKNLVLGTRVKMLDNKTGLYAWVVVTTSGTVINFERDIRWSTLRGRRVTEVWLHDAYPSHPGRKTIPTDAAKLYQSLS